MFGIVQKTLNLKGGGIEFGTENTRGLLNRLGAPDEGLKIIHIAGTNGKGSTAEYISRILVAAGKKTGTFTSPQVMDFFDQFRIDCSPLKRRAMEKYLKKAYKMRGNCTSFEVMTAAAFYAFYKEGCEYAVVECGMGGLSDATNAVKKKEIALISSIGLEHTAFLGNSIGEICRHKAGIIKDCPAIVNALQPDEAVEYFKKLNVKFADKPLSVSESSNGRQRFLYGGDEFEINMAGNAQPYNAAVAIEAARLLKIDENSIHSGLFNARLSGRIQFFYKGGRTFIVDGGHNPSGVVPLKTALENYPAEDVTLIFGCLSDKDIDKILVQLQGLAGRAIAVKPPSPRAMDGDKIFAACKKYFGAAQTAESVCAALEKSEGTTVVCGSFTLVKEAVKWIEKKL